MGFRLHQTEADFTRQFIAFAKLHKWRVAHFRAARTAKGGWRTPVQGDGKGFPDTILIRGERLVVAELKVGYNKPTPEQQAWLEAFYGVCGEAYVWYPGDWPEIEEVLK